MLTTVLTVATVAASAAVYWLTRYAAFRRALMALGACLLAVVSYALVASAYGSWLP